MKNTNHKSMNYPQIQYFKQKSKLLWRTRSKLEGHSIELK